MFCNSWHIIKKRHMVSEHMSSGSPVPRSTLALTCKSVAAKAATAAMGRHKRTQPMQTNQWVLWPHDMCILTPCKVPETLLGSALVCLVSVILVSRFRFLSNKCNLIHITEHQTICYLISWNIFLLKHIFCE